MLAPETTLKTKPIRAQILFVLELREEACHQYDTLFQSHSESQQLVNNVGICRFRERERALRSSREHVDVRRCAGLCGENLRRFDAWLAEFRDKLSDNRTLTPEESNKFAGTIMW